MTDDEEKAWVEGERAALRRIMLDCARQLGAGDRDADNARMLAERVELRSALIELIEEYGGETADIPPNLYLPDIVKRLGRTFAQREGAD